VLNCWYTHVIRSRPAINKICKNLQNSQKDLQNLKEDLQEDLQDSQEDPQDLQGFAKISGILADSSGILSALHYKIQIEKDERKDCVL
jgi:hypothetical protein